MGAVRLNGVDRKFAADEMPATLAELLRALNIEPASVVAEVDGAILRSEDFARTQIADGQCIELVRFMGGG